MAKKKELTTKQREILEKAQAEHRNALIEAEATKQRVITVLDLIGDAHGVNLLDGSCNIDKDGSLVEQKAKKDPELLQE